jgi:hypothetical protein
VRVVAEKMIIGGIGPARTAGVTVGMQWLTALESAGLSREGRQPMTIPIDWSDPALQAILACPDGSQAWKMVDTYLGPIRDAIWAKRRAARPKRGGRRTASQREAGQKLLAEALEEGRRMREDVEMEEEMLRRLNKRRLA